MTRIGLIGAGNIGSTIARLADKTGHEVVLSNSRGADTLTELAARLGPHVHAGTISQAADADIVVLTIPLSAVPALPHDLPDALTDTIVIDTMNYYPERDGHIPALDERHTTTSEMTAQALPGAKVVKGFNNIVHSHLLDLARPSGSPERSALPIATDYPEAKEVVVALMRDLGYDAVDAGTLKEGWRFENGQPAYCLPYAANPDALRNSVPGQRPLETRQVTVENLKAALEQAH